MNANPAKKKWLTDRTRLLLTLELAIMLPAAALMLFNFWNLHSIQRNKAIEAAIQRDFTHVLKIAEIKTWTKATDILTPLPKEFPCGQDPSEIKPQLDKLLAAHPEFLYAILYDKERDRTIWRARAGREDDEEFNRRMAGEVARTMKWVPLEAPDLAHKLRMMEAKGDKPFGFYSYWEDGKDDERYFSSVAYFIPAEVPEEDVTLGIVGFDPEYLRRTFFPGVINDVLSSKSIAVRADANPPALMVHPSKSYTPWIASANWDGGKAEMERPLSDVF